MGVTTIKEYSKPQLKKVKLTSKEQVLINCNTGQIGDYGECYWCASEPKLAVYGPVVDQYNY